VVAALLAAGEPKMVAQEIEQRDTEVGDHPARLAVHFQFQRYFGGAHGSRITAGLAHACNVVIHGSARPESGGGKTPERGKSSIAKRELCGGLRGQFPPTRNLLPPSLFELRRTGRKFRPPRQGEVSPGIGNALR